MPSGHSAPRRDVRDELGAIAASRHEEGVGWKAAPTEARWCLVVDEDEGVRWMLAEALGAVGYAVLERSCAEEALEVVDSHRGLIDLLVTDLMMPRMKGLEVAERLIRLRPGTKILIMSSRLPNDARACRRVREAGLFLAKPFSLRRFVSRVCRALALEYGQPVRRHV